DLVDIKTDTVTTSIVEQNVYRQPDPVVIEEQRQTQPIRVASLNNTEITQKITQNDIFPQKDTLKKSELKEKKPYNSVSKNNDNFDKSMFEFLKIFSYICVGIVIILIALLILFVIFMLKYFSNKN
ncbi:MAG: hypothetical protein WC755_08295, partial [Candidatus Woesearchaeota archaeon]